MNLDKLAIGVKRPGGVAAARSAARADHRHRRATKDKTAATRGDNHGVGWKRPELHRDEILADRTAAPARVIDHGLQKIPELPLLHLASNFPPPHLLIQGIEKLLTGRRTSKGSPLVERATKSPLVAEALRCAVERHSEPIHQVNNARTPFRHFLDGRLMLEEVTAVDGVIKVLPLVVALLPCLRVDTVDATLCARGMRPFYRHEAHKIDVDPEFGKPHGRRKPSQPTANYQNPLTCHLATLL